MSEVESVPEVVQDKSVEVKQDKPLTEKQKKKNMTSYWGVELGNDVFDREDVKTFLEAHPELMPLKKIHNTRYYVDKKETEDSIVKEAQFYPLEKKECNVFVDAYGWSSDAMALRVEKVTCVNDTGETVVLPFFETQQHVTMALKDKIPAKDSVKTLLGEEGSTIVTFPEKFTLTGTLKRYLF